MLTPKSSILISLIITATLFGLANISLSKFTVSERPIASVETVSPSPVAVLGVATKTTDCVSEDGMPDRGCTPGAIDPHVTADNLSETICKKGYTATVRPPVSYTNKLKAAQIEAYGYTDKVLRAYEEDHLIPLELGGSPTDPANLWPEYGSIPNPKDKIENLCNRKVCEGAISLHDAQIQIATNWKTACAN